MRSFVDIWRDLTNVTRQIIYHDTIWIFRHFLGSFVCTLRVAAYLFFHQSRQCQDDKLVCQMVSATKFSFVKNIYVTEKPGNCCRYNPRCDKYLTKHKTTFHLIDIWHQPWLRWHGPHAAPGATDDVTWSVISQSEASTGCHQPMRGLYSVVMIWWPAVVITWPRPGPGWPQPVSPRPHHHPMSPDGQCQPIRGLYWGSLTNERPVLSCLMVSSASCHLHLLMTSISLWWPLPLCCPGTVPGPALSPGPALAPTVCSGRCRDQLWDTGSREWRVSSASGAMG